jgi:hypothetical protein
VSAEARTGSLAGLAKSPWRGIGRRLSWSSKILPGGLDRPTSGYRRPFPHIRSAILKTSRPMMPTFYTVRTDLGVGWQAQIIREIKVWRGGLASLPFDRARIGAAASNRPELFLLRRQVQLHVINSSILAIIMRPDRASAPAFWPISSAFALSGGEWHRRFRIPRRALVRSGLNWPSR